MAVGGFKIDHPETNQVISDFNLCKTFGWTINELYCQSSKRIAYFSAIISEENRIAKQKQQQQEFESRCRRR